jgi:micrococcal nuclease
MNKLAIVFCLVSLILTSNAFAEKICHVQDGDTFRLCNGQRIRLWGIDAPELKQPLGLDAKFFLMDIAKDKDVQLDCKDKSYNRLVCQATLEGSDLGMQMVSTGLAFDYEKFSKGFYCQFEEYAKKQNRGVWQSPDGGERPWDYRKRLQRKSR